MDGEIVDGTVFVTPSSKIQFGERISANAISLDGITYAIRVTDNQAKALLKFSGFSAYDYDPVWRLEAEFVPFSEIKHVELNRVFDEQFAKTEFKKTKRGRRSPLESDSHASIV